MLRTDILISSTAGGGRGSRAAGTDTDDPRPGLLYPKAAVSCGGYVPPGNASPPGGDRAAQRVPGGNSRPPLPVASPVASLPANQVRRRQCGRAASVRAIMVAIAVNRT